MILFRSRPLAAKHLIGLKKIKEVHYGPPTLHPNLTIVAIVMEPPSPWRLW